MSTFILLTVIQSLLITFDEFYFHHQRKLPRWERIGHPADSLTVLACLSFLVFAERTATHEMFYIVMAIGSCIFVTKDEWVHHKFCSAEEMWLHACLFMVHPFVLISAMTEWETSPLNLIFAAAGVFAFTVYQIVYWNFMAPKIEEAKTQAHYAKASQDELYEYFGE